MKRYRIIYLAIISLILCSCIKNELVLPNSQKEEIYDEIDLIAKPTDVTFIGDYDYGYKVKWPEFNDKIEKVSIAYTDGGEKKLLEITDFDKDFSFFTEGFKEYTFTVVAFDKSGRASKPAIMKATNKEKYAIQVLTDARVIQNGAYVRVKWNNELLRDLKVSVKSTVSKKELVSTDTVGIVDIPILVDKNGVNVLIEDMTTGIKFDKDYTLTEQGADFSGAFKANWTIFYDSPYNNQGWWNMEEAFDGIYSTAPDLGATPKLNAVKINGVTKLNVDQRIRTVYFTFTQKRNNINASDSQYDLRMINPPGPYDNLLLQEIRYVFKAPANNAVWPNQVRIYGIKLDGSEVLIANITNVESRMVQLRTTDPDFVKALIVPITQTTIESANFRGLKSDIISESIPGNTNSDDWRNIIGLGEIFVKGVRSGL
jgi:hypothetical protein